VVDLLKSLMFVPVDLGPLDSGAGLTQIDKPLIGLHLKLVGKLEEWFSFARRRLTGRRYSRSRHRIGHAALVSE
jgi:hypothetical protein